MAFRECPDPKKPITISLLTNRFGFPKGIEGRGENEITAILIHCVADLEAYYQECNSNSIIRPRGAAKTSVHYGIPLNGKVQQYVSDANIAWGLSPTLAQGATVPTYPVCDSSINLEVDGDVPDASLIHIAVEFPKQRVLLDKSRNNSECDCAAGFDELLSKGQTDNLIHLLAYLAFTYDINLDTSHINYLHLVSSCGNNECGCEPCIIQLLCAVGDYCQALQDAKDTSFQENEETDIVAFYGEDQFGNKKRISATEMFAFFNSGSIRVPNRVNWENVVRDAPINKHIIFESGTYTKTQVGTIPIKNGQHVEGQGRNVTTILDATGKSLFRASNPINSSTQAKYKLEAIGIFCSVLPALGSAGFEDTGSGDITLFDVYIGGFDSNLILDQSETARIWNSRFDNARSNAIWIVNGSQRRAGASTDFSNDIHFIGCTVSGGDALTNYLVRDDGGSSHTYRNCIFNGGMHQFFGAGLQGYLLSGCYFEGAQSRVIRLDYLRPDASGGPGRCLGGEISGGCSINAGLHASPVIQLISGNGLEVTGNTITGDAAGYVFATNPDFDNITAFGNAQTMKTWQASPAPRSLSRNSATVTEPFLIGLGYPGETATNEEIQAWFEGAKKRGMQNKGIDINAASQLISTAGAISTSILETEIVTLAPTAYTLGVGVNGQSKWIGMTANAGDGTITVSNGNGFAIIVLNDVGQNLELKYKANKWWIVSNNGATIS